MKLRLDSSKTYAIALQGGGAMGAYEIGAWKAMEEAGIQFDAVAGTSVGALNGAFMVMGDLPAAEKIWEDMHLGNVIAVSEANAEEMKKLVAGKADFTDISALSSALAEVIRNKGLDAAPLRAWMQGAIDAEKIKQSGKSLYVATFSVSDGKGLELRVNDLPADQICDMLLASAYHPSFKAEKLGGKYFADGGFVDVLPIHPLIKNGYKDIIAVSLPSFGFLRPVRAPKGTSITYIRTNEDLGGTLNFDAQQSKKDLQIGYYDAKRVLYGLYGRHNYIDRTMSDKQALDYMIRRMKKLYPGESLRHIVEVRITALGLLHGIKGDYYDIFAAQLDADATECGLPSLRVVEDIELAREIERAKPAVPKKTSAG